MVREEVPWGWGPKRPQTGRRGGWPGCQGRMGWVWVTLVLRAGFGTCCWGGRTALLDSQFCTHYEGSSLLLSAALGTTAQAAPAAAYSPTGRPPALAWGTSLGAERELEPGSNSWPCSSVPQGPPPSFPGPHLSLFPGCNPPPKNTLQGMWSDEAPRRPPAGRSHLPPGYREAGPRAPAGRPARPRFHPSAGAQGGSISLQEYRLWVGGKSPGHLCQPAGLRDPQQLPEPLHAHLCRYRNLFHGCRPSW